MRPDLAHIRNWIFDLDNTLYPVGSRIFDLVDARMGEFIAGFLGIGSAEAHRLQKRYFLEHGTTLSGMIADHAVDPRAFLDFVHDIDLGALAHDAPLAATIAALPGRKLVFTNADASYATRVLDRLGLGSCFEGVHDIHAMELVPKPAARAYAGLCARFAIDPAESLFVEDMARNLRPAKAIGMTTLWVDNGSEQAADADRSYIDYTTHHLHRWLERALEDQ